MKPNGAGTGERAGLKTNKTNDEARMSNDEGMTNFMNPTHSVSLPLLLKPNGAGACERAGLKTNKTNDEARMSNDEGMANLMNPAHSLSLAMPLM